MHLSSSTTHATASTPKHDDIAQCARELWIESGRPANRDEAIWLEAERRLVAARRAPAAVRSVMPTFFAPSNLTTVTLAITPTHMFEERIKELESQLATAGETVASLTRLNAELTERLSDAETRNKKLKRSARRDESSLKEQLAVAQSRRG
jgi:uncharacterized coiled-coil protein SlyX